MSDGAVIVQFLNAVAEIAGGACEPSIAPVWRRELLSARDPPRITCTHREYEQVPNNYDPIWTQQSIAHQSFFFGPKKLEAIRQLISHYNAQYVTRGKSNPPLLPLGYYGNSFVYRAAVTTVGKLCENSLGFSLELVKKAKAQASTEYIQSMADLMVIKGRPCFIMLGTWFVSDTYTSRLGFRDVDFGWGKAVYGVLAVAGAGSFP
ncbi:hypothetical protein K1719_035593 [Acacia pycnantha]|nr:hypothetical protein K1719_035593 [Acacia pycnantha]